MSDSNGIGIDINGIIKSAYSTALEILQSATELVGTDCLWARATPVINSEDVIFQEYTLTQVGLECPKTIRVVVSNTDYNPGEYTIDLYGLGYVQPLEINITILEWSNTFGTTTMPQKGDIVYVQIYHKLFEVLSSELMYTIAALPTYYKIVLSKYSPSASRQETEEFRESVKDFTDSQEDLFGDVISEEVADNNVTVETSYNNTTYVDPVKDFDIDSIVVEQIKGKDGNLITNAYYDFTKAETNITYHTDLIYNTGAVRNHLIYSCWCMRESTSVDSKNIKKLVFYSKDKDYWYFRISTPLKLNDGDNVVITRGTLLRVNAIVTQLDDCANNELGIAIRTSDMTKSLRKLTKWYENSLILKIYKLPIFNLLRGYDANNKVIFNIDIKSNELIMLIGNKTKHIPVNIELISWHYFMFDISPDNIHIIIEQTKSSNVLTVEDYTKVDENISLLVPNFNVNEFRIENIGTNLYICNIRLYENEYEMGDNYKLDKYSPITENASKLIFVDSPNVPNKEMFVTPIK